MLPRSHAPARSFTLVELLVTLGIIILLLGLTAGVYFGLVRVNAIVAESGAIQAIIASAQTTAVDEAAETFVCIDAAKGTLYPFVRRKVGVWHLETLEDSPARSPGAFGHAALIKGSAAATLVDGKVGKALQFDGSSFLACKMLHDVSWVNIPTYDAREGFAFEAFIMPDDSAQTPQTILSRDGWFRVQLRNDPGPLFALAAEIVSLDPDGSGYLRRSATSSAVIRRSEWTHVRVSAHKFGTALALEINGVPQVPAISGSDTAASPSSAAETALAAKADGSEPFHGRLDEAIFSAYAVDDAYQVTSKLKLEAQGLAEGNTIRFDPSGRLAAVHNGTPPRIILKDVRGHGKIDAQVTITVGTMGALDVQTIPN